MPSYNFCKRLCDFNEDNQNAEMLLIGDRRFVVKPVRAIMPKKT